MKMNESCRLKKECTTIEHFRRVKIFYEKKKKIEKIIFVCLKKM